jgi:hypothetical protein
MIYEDSNISRALYGSWLLERLFCKKFTHLFAAASVLLLMATPNMIF